MGLGLAALVVAELGLRLVGVAGGASWTPPRLVHVVQNGEVQGEFEVSSAAHFVEEALEGQPGFRTAEAFALGRGTGFPVSGAMRDEHFTAVPAPGVERFVVLGGSAAMGQAPIGRRGGAKWNTERLANGVQALPDHLALSGQLERRLTEAGRRAEVINAGMIAQDSAGVRRIAEEALQWQPDALVLYLGNNEGIGLSAGMGSVEIPRLAPVRDTLRGLRLYRVLADRLVPARQRMAEAPPDQVSGMLPEVLGRITLTQWQSAGRPLMRGSTPTDEVHAALLARFSHNLGAIVDAAHAAGVQVYVIPTPPHLEYLPFFTGHDPRLGPADHERFQAALNQARLGQQRKDWPKILRSGEEMAAVDPHSAAAHHLRGIGLDGLGRHDEAMEALLQALALDLSRKRSQPVFTSIAADLCADKGCVAGDAHGPLVAEGRRRGLEAWRERFGDHEHLLPEGNAWIAELFADLIVENPPAESLPR
jgi:hypothetical protein